MKVTVRSSSSQSKTKRSTARTSTRASRGTVSRMAKKASRASKQTLRDILLSKTFHAGFKVLAGFFIGGSMFYGAYALVGKSVENDVVISQSEILARISKHTMLPAGNPEAVVRVQDADALQKEAIIYQNVKIGDYIVVYPSIVVVYDLYNDKIVALKSSAP